MNQAQQFLEHIMKCSPRPKKNSRIELAQSILEYIIGKYSVIRDVHPDSDLEEKIIDVEDIEELLKQLDSLKD